MDDCPPHHWLLDPPMPEGTPAVCAKCFAIKMFHPQVVESMFSDFRYFRYSDNLFRARPFLGERDEPQSEYD